MAKSNKKSIEEITYEKYKTDPNIKKDALYELLNKRFSDTLYNYLPLSPLNIAILMNDLNEVESLLANGHNINEKNEEGLTPLGEATILNNYKIVKYLIKNGANINGTNKFIPLIISAETGNAKIMQLLLENGADANQLDINNFNSLQHLFNYGGLLKLKSQLWSRIIPYHFLYKEKYQKSKLDCINLLYNAGIDINYTTKIRYCFDFKEESFLIEISALTLALNNIPVTSSKVIKRLIELGIEPKAYELNASEIYAYQDSFNFFYDIKEKDISAWKDALLEYLFYLKYLSTIKKYNLKMYTGSPNDGYKRSKLIKILKKE